MKHEYLVIGHRDNTPVVFGPYGSHKAATFSRSRLQPMYSDPMTVTDSRNLQHHLTPRA